MRSSKYHYNKGKMATIFSRIASGEIPCYKIGEDDRYLAFLDINPLAKGHTLVIPKKEIDYIFDLEDDLLSGMIVFSKKLQGLLMHPSPASALGLQSLGLRYPTPMFI